MKYRVLTLAAILAVSMAAAAQNNAIVSTKYIAAQEALAADDLAKAKSALSDLAKESQGEIQVRARAAADAASLGAVRKAFKPLSETVAKMQLPKGYVVAFCPMYDKGAHWVQKEGNVSNPYYGKSMLTCGEIKK